MNFNNIYDFNLAVARYGFNDHIPKTVYGFTNYEFPKEKEKLNIKNLKGKLFIEGLDTNYNEIKQQYIEGMEVYRINSAYTIDWINDDEIEIGTITRINPKRTITENAAFSVPYYWDAFILSMSSPATEEIELVVNSRSVNSFVNYYKYEIPFRVNGGSDIMFSSYTDNVVMMEILLIK